MTGKNLKGLAQQGMIGVLVFFLSSAAASAATYYVRTDGNNANSGTANSSGGAWRTIDWAADNVSAGDVIRVQAGAYPERVTPGINGTSVNNTVTFVADGVVTVCRWWFTNASYIRIIGFVIDSNAGCSTAVSDVDLSGTNNYLEFWHNTFQDATEHGARYSFNVSERVNNTIFINNIFRNFGVGTGSGMALYFRGSNNLYAYNELYNMHPDGFYIEGVSNRWINNYTHDFSESSGGHSDIFQAGSSPLGLSDNLFEANFQVGMGNLGDEHTAQISHAQSGNCGGTCGAMTENIFRKNVWHNVSQYTVGINQTSVGPVSHTRYYHNTTADARVGPNDTGARYGIEWYGPNPPNGYILNNIEYDSWGSGATSALPVYYVSGALTVDYNLAYDPGGPVTFASPWTTQAHPQSNVNPGFVDYATDNFTLSASSGAIGTGGPLTTVSGSGTGTTFNVTTRGGGYFRGDNTNLSQYGGNLVVGDTITVGTDVVTIASISGDAITVSTPFTWANGEPVFFGSSTTPAIGAYPYKPGGYSLSASYSQSGTTVTVTPSDPSLVRFVVCSDDGVPTTVDSVGPFTCPAGSGSLVARVYPFYASKTLSVTAVPGPPPPTSAPAAPTNLRIIQ